jgi:hypothetical protein
LEQKYQLTKDAPQEKINLRFTAYSKNLKQNLESLFRELNRMAFITSKQMYEDALKLFHIEIKAANKGYLIFVTDDQGNPVRYPMKISDFEARPKFYQIKPETERTELSSDYSKDKSDNSIRNHQGNSRILVDLLRLVSNYSDRNSFRKKNQMIKRRRKGQKRF